VFVKGGLSSIIPETKKQATISSLWGTKKKRKRNDPEAAIEEQSDSSVTETPLPSSSSPADSLSSQTDPLTVLKVDYDLEDKKFSGEGRTITLEFPSFFLVNCYVPNSGQKLERLAYRTDEWYVQRSLALLMEIRDPALTAYLKSLEASGKPVILTGDLNVAHLDLDIHNPMAKHLSKQAGVTPQERQSFGNTLAQEFQDALRFFYPGPLPSRLFLLRRPSLILLAPEHEGQFTYWSIRTNARPENKGLRLDYFMCSKTLFVTPSEMEDETREANRVSSSRSPLVRDCGILHEFGVGTSDHCPISLSLQL
jgi:exonuclease III